MPLYGSNGGAEGKGVIDVVRNYSCNMLYPSVSFDIIIIHET